MKILLLNKYWEPVGGVEQHAFAVHEWLKSRGHEVIPFAMSSPAMISTAHSHFFPSSVDFRADSMRDKLKATQRAIISRDSRASLRALIRQVKPDAAYALHIYHQLGNALLNELHHQHVPTVLSLHDYKIACGNYRLFSERTDEICMRCLKHRFSFLYAPTVEGCWDGKHSAGLVLSAEMLATSLRGSYKKPQAVTFLNKLQRKSALFAGVKAQRLVHVPHPVRLNAPPPHKPGVQFLYVGRLAPEKGVGTLIKAVALVDVPLVIAGDGRSREQLERLATKLGARVRFLGSVAHAQAETLMRSSTALVVPSIWHEVSPLVVYEAIANDLPVIATRVGGMPDQIGDGRGYLVPHSDPEALAHTMAKVVSDPTEASRRSSTARSYAAAKWSHEAWSQNMQSAFNLAGVRV